MGTDRVDVIIPTLHKCDEETKTEYLNGCLESILNNTDKDRAIVHVIENMNSFPEAINLGLSESTNDVILLNDDTIVSDEWITNIQKFPGAVKGFKLLYPNITIIQHAGGTIVGNFVGLHVGQGAIDVGQFNWPYPCPFVTFAAVYLTRKVLDQLPTLTTEFGSIYFEDVDYCFRAWSLGLTVIYTPVPIIHMESATMKKNEKLKEIFENSYKNYSAKWASMETIVMLRDRIAKWDGESDEVSTIQS
jgi:GT2 family glycosyltransferase